MSACESKPKKVAIVGKAPASIFRTPFDDPDYEIWSLSDNYTQIPRWDRWFELHDVEWHRRMHPPHWQFLTTDHDKPLYLLDKHPDIPHAKPFPKAEIFKRFPEPQYHHYFTNSVSWFIALALMEGFERIGIYGVDMAQHEEYAHQRPSCEYWIGVANALGVQVDVPGESDLMKAGKLYGYETHSGQFYVKLRARDNELAERISQSEKQKAEAEKQAQLYFGGVQVVQKLRGSLNGQLTPELDQTLQQLEGDMQGRVAQCSNIAGECDKRIWKLEGAREDLQWARQWT